MWSVESQEDDHVVLLEHGVMRIAREPPRLEERERPCSSVTRRMRPPRCRNPLPEVRKPPADRDAEPRRRRLVASLEGCESILELPPCSANIVGTHLCRHELVVQRRYEHFDAAVLHNSESVEHMLLRRQRGHARPLRRGAAQPVDELVDPRAPERGGGRARQGLSPRQPHARKRTRPRRIRLRTTRTFA